MPNCKTRLCSPFRRQIWHKFPLSYETFLCQHLVSKRSAYWLAVHPSFSLWLEVIVIHLMDRNAKWVLRETITYRSVILFWQNHISHPADLIFEPVSVSLKAWEKSYVKRTHPERRTPNLLELDKLDLFRSLEECEKEGFSLSWGGAVTLS